MMIPVRCFTCGRLVGQAWEPFQLRVRDGEDPQEVMEDLGLERYCCRRMLMGHVDLIDEVSKYII